MLQTRRTRSKQNLNEHCQESLNDLVRETEGKLNNLSLGNVDDEFLNVSNDTDSPLKGKYYQDPVWKPKVRGKIKEDVQNIGKFGVWSPALSRPHKFRRKRGHTNIVNPNLRKEVDGTNIINSKLRRRMNSSIDECWIPNEELDEEKIVRSKPRTRQRKKEETVVVISKENDFPLRSILKTNRPCKAKLNQTKRAKKVTFVLPSIGIFSTINMRRRRTRWTMSPPPASYDQDATMSPPPASYDQDAGIYTQHEDILEWNDSQYSNAEVDQNDFHVRKKKKLTLSAADITDLLLELSIHDGT